MEKYMTADDALMVIEDLSNSQGFYGRLLRAINRDYESYISFSNWVNDNKFTDSLDLILALEN